MCKLGGGVCAEEGGYIEKDDDASKSRYFVTAVWNWLYGRADSQGFEATRWVLHKARW